MNRSRFQNRQAIKKRYAISYIPLCWDTRTRTRNDRTRICSVTITPYPNKNRFHLYTGHAVSFNKKRCSQKNIFLVGIPGLEPGMTGPESVVLPLHHIPIYNSISIFPNCDAKVHNLCYTHKHFTIFFLKNIKITRIYTRFTINQCTFA